MEIINQIAEKALSKTSISLGNYVLNPFRGCLLGCKYCYVQCNKGIKKIKKEWGEYLYVKENFITLLKKELIELNDIHRILIGSTTEVFQPVEEYNQITIEALELLYRKNIPFVMLTKQPHISDYIKLISYSKENFLYFTINSEIIRKLFEKRSFSMEERILAMEKCYKNKINTIAYVGPFFPFLTEIDVLLKKLSGKTEKIYIEAYHPNMGNFNEIKEILKEEKNILMVLEDERAYYDYWNKIKEETSKLNTTYGFEIKFFIPDYKKYY